MNARVVPGRHVIVTGGSGRIGGYVVPALRGAGHRIECLDLRPAADGTPTRVIDILDIADLRRVFAGADAIVHLAGLDMDAACASEDFIRVNVQGTWNVLQAAQTSSPFDKLTLRQAHPSTSSPFDRLRVRRLGG